MSLLAVTVLGHDRPGIIATVTGVLSDLGGNLEDSSMTLLRGHFAMTLVVRTEAEEAEVREALVPIAGDDSGLVVSVLALADESAAAAVGQTHLLSVHGADRPGIVSAVTGLLADVGGNVTDLTTRLAGQLYVLTAEVEFPAGTDADALNARLGDLATDLGVEASLRPADADLL